MNSNLQTLINFQPQPGQTVITMQEWIQFLTKLNTVLNGLNSLVLQGNYTFSTLPVPQNQTRFAQCTDGSFAVYNTVVGAWEKINQVNP